MGKQDPLNMLISWAYWECFDWDEIRRIQKQIPLRILLDCGASTILNSGGKKQFNLDEYCEWCKAHEDVLWGYLMFDVIYDGEKTFANYQYMRNKGVKPIPIFTPGQKLYMLHEYWKDTDFVAFGGVKRMGTERYAIAVCQTTKRHNKKCHLLGMTRIPFIFKWRPYSCDSISYLSGSRFGTYYFWNPNTLTMHQYKRKNSTRFLNNTDFLKMYERYNLDPTVLINEKSYHGFGGRVDKVQLTSTISWVRCMRHLTRLGVNLWLASSNRESTFELMLAYDLDTKTCPVLSA